MRSGTDAAARADPWQDLATSITVAAQPARRLLVTRDENQSRSRLLVVWLRVENAGDATVAFSPDDVALVFADRTIGTTLDRPRAEALIERLDVAPTDEAAADYPELWTIARRPNQQANLKRQLSDGLLTERSLGTEAMEGYLVFDTRQLTSSLDGASLRVVVVRNHDGAKLRQLYRFAPPPRPLAGSHRHLWGADHAGHGRANR